MNDIDRATRSSLLTEIQLNVIPRDLEPRARIYLNSGCTSKLDKNGGRGTNVDTKTNGRT